MRTVADNPKRELRSMLRPRRRAQARARDRAADDAALAQHVVGLVAHLGLGPGATATLYEARPEEPPTHASAAALAAHGIRVLLPLTLPDLDLDWCAAGDADETPLGLDAIAGAQLLLVPGLSVDVRGTRLGQGGGCYDKALPRRMPGWPVIVVLHPEEFPASSDLPRDAHDVPVDAVVTADGVHWLNPRWASPQRAHNPPRNAPSPSPPPPASPAPPPPTSGGGD